MTQPPAQTHTTRRFLTLLLVVFAILALTVVGLFAALKYTEPTGNSRTLMGTTAGGTPSPSPAPTPPTPTPPTPNR